MRRRRALGRGPRGLRGGGGAGGAGAPPGARGASALQARERAAPAARRAGAGAGRCARGSRPPRGAPPCPTDGGDSGGAASGLGVGLRDLPPCREEGLAAFAPCLDRQVPVTAARKPRSQTAPQPLSHPVFLNFSACASTAPGRERACGRASPRPSPSRQVFPESPCLSYST